MRNLGRALFAIAIAVTGVQGLAQTPAARISTADFAALPNFRKPVLSPDGHRLAARTTSDGKTKLVILNADRPLDAPKQISLGDGKVAALRWAGNQRLLLTVQVSQKVAGYGEVPFLRLVAIETANLYSWVVDPRSRGIYAGDVLYTAPDGGWALVASQNDVYSYPSVKRVDLSTGAVTVVEKARPDVWDWYADDKGVVRAGVAIEGRSWTVWYRDNPVEKLRAIRGKFPRDDDSTIDRFIFRGENSWIVTNERTGRFALYKYGLKNNAIGATIFEHAEVDLDDLVYDPITGEISAILYHDDRQRIRWLDKEMEELQARLDKALPNSVNMTTGWSSDERRVLVFSAGASNPGQYFLLDRDTRKMNPVIDPYPRVDPEKLSEVKPVRYRTRDGLTLRAFLTVPRGAEGRNLPLIVMPHGGPFARDEWTYDPLVQLLANRGYAVLQPQFRGSTGFGKDFVARGYGEYGRKMQDDLDDGVDWLAKSGTVDPKRVCIVGSSYGGYAALWGAIRNPERYRCAVSIAGVTDLPAQLRFDRKSFAASRYFREWRTKIGGEGKVDLAQISPISFAERLKTPVLILHGEADQTVPVKQGHAMVEKLTKAGANVTSAFYKESGHDFDNAADFEDVMRRIEAFLAKHNPS